MDEMDLTMTSPTGINELHDDDSMNIKAYRGTSPPLIPDLMGLPNSECTLPKLKPRFSQSFSSYTTPINNGSFRSAKEEQETQFRVQMKKEHGGDNLHPLDPLDPLVDFLTCNLLPKELASLFANKIRKLSGVKPQTLVTTLKNWHYSFKEDKDLLGMFKDVLGIKKEFHRKLLCQALREVAEYEPFVLICYDETADAVDEVIEIKELLKNVGKTAKTLESFNFQQLENNHKSIKVIHFACHGINRHPVNDHPGLRLNEGLNPTYFYDRILQCCDKGSIQCIFLNACHSIEITKKLSQMFNTNGTRAYFISWETIVNTRAATEFATSFYRYLRELEDPSCSDFFHAYEYAVECLRSAGWNLVDPIKDVDDDCKCSLWNRAAGVPHIHTSFMKMERSIYFNANDVFMLHDWDRNNGIQNDRIRYCRKLMEEQQISVAIKEYNSPISNKLFIESSRVLLVFITQSLLFKSSLSCNLLEGNQIPREYPCIQEFNHMFDVQGTFRMVPVIIEKECLDTSQWEGPLKHLKSITPINLTGTMNERQDDSILAKKVNQRLKSTFLHYCMYLDLINFRFVQSDQEKRKLLQYYLRQLKMNVSTAIRSSSTQTTSMVNEVVKLDETITNGFYVEIGMFVPNVELEKVQEKMDVNLFPMMRMLSTDKTCLRFGACVCRGGRTSNTAKKVYEFVVKKFRNEHKDHETIAADIDNIMENGNKYFKVKNWQYYSSQE